MVAMVSIAGKRVINVEFQERIAEDRTRKGASCPYSCGDSSPYPD
jgi:hypothetical protein